MTNGITEDLEDCSPEELAFWGFDLPGEAMILRDEPPAHVYDLEERTAKFGELIILFSKKIPWSPVNNRLIDQLVGAGTAWVRITAKRTTEFPALISSIASAFLERNRAKQNSFSAWSQPPNPN